MSKGLAAAAIRKVRRIRGFERRIGLLSCFRVNVAVCHGKFKAV
jgi:hypothetical protein